MSFDPRMKLFVVIVVGIFTFILSESGLICITAAMALYMAVNAMTVKALKNCIVFALMFLLQKLLYAVGDETVAVFGLMTVFIMRFVPAVMAATVLGAVSPGEMIASLQKLRIPKMIIIPIAVGLRFLPSFWTEYGAVRDAARLRGVSLRFRNIITKPGRTLECVYVPILMRSLTISDSLAASAYTRGLDNPKRRTSLHESKIGAADIVVLVLVVALIGALLYLGI